MKGFILGILVTIAAIILIGLFIAETGRVDMRADQAPSRFERRLAGGAMDASVDRNAPKVTNPLQPADATLIAGAKIYADHCALCHGDPAHPESPLAKSFYPRPPQFMTDAADMGDRDNYYITEHGVRWTAMPAWDKVLSQNDIWQVVTFIGHMGNLPPDVKAVFALQAPPPAAKPSKKPAEKRKKH
jgi:mono/diheme cytochrome c family protein